MIQFIYKETKERKWLKVFRYKNGKLDVIETIPRENFKPTISEYCSMPILVIERTGKIYLLERKQERSRPLKQYVNYNRMRSWAVFLKRYEIIARLLYEN